MAVSIGDEITRTGLFFFTAHKLIEVCEQQQREREDGQLHT